MEDLCRFNPRKSSTFKDVTFDGTKTLESFDKTFELSEFEIFKYWSTIPEYVALFQDIALKSDKFPFAGG